MKALFTFVLLAVAANIADAQWAQPNDPATIQNNSRGFGRPHQENPPLLHRVTSHSPSFTAFPARSFYKSQRDWRRIIDSTWGPGLPTASKLNLFDTYVSRVENRFEGFLSLGLTPASWDSLKAAYRGKITDSTSRGGFAAIMSYFTMTLKSGHTFAFDTVLFNTPLNPGVPILMLSGFLTVEHFGAVLTALPDSSLLVIRTVANHPLSLQPGDVILGYERRPWKTLVRELMAAELPAYDGTTGAASAFADGLLLGAGMNWHLFDTIDVRKASTGQTLHLSVNPLITLPSSPMLNNEQLPIPGIPFPDFFNGQSVSYGIVPNTNVGYIYLYEENATITDNEFHQAYLALQGTDALIIDMRLNFGGWSLFPQTFAKMFNEPITTIEDAYRCSPSTWTLCPIGNSATFGIPGEPPQQWEKPIAVLLGPTCGSMGDITAQRLRYHDMVKFFGKSCGGFPSEARLISGFSGWVMWYAISDLFHTSTPGVYLNRREFPIDYPVWFTSAGVAAGHDGVVDEALNWIQHAVYPHDLTTDRRWYRRNADTLRLVAQIENPDSHPISSRVYMHLLSGAVIDSIGLQIAGGTTGSGWLRIPNLEETFRLRITANDMVTGRAFAIRNSNRITTKGPAILDTIISGRYSATSYWVRPFFRNDGSTATLTDLSVALHSHDPWIRSITPGSRAMADVPPDSVMSAGDLSVDVDTTCPGYFNMHTDVSEQGWVFWQDSVRVFLPTTGVESTEGLPKEFALAQNYPNPFNPTTEIRYQTPEISHVTLRVFDIVGREVATLVNEVKQPGTYTVQWNASNLASGIYFYRLKAGEFVGIKKLILLK